jgi:hypothetical protein
MINSFIHGAVTEAFSQLASCLPIRIASIRLGLQVCTTAPLSSYVALSCLVIYLFLSSFEDWFAAALMNR